MDSADEDPIGQPPGVTSADAMFGSLQTNYMRLTALADQKASILVGAATVVIGFLAPVDDPPIALIVLAITAALAGTAGILSLLPRVGQSNQNGRHNPLFFGYHSQIDSESFADEIGEVTRDRAATHRAIIEDIHQMGMVLTRKFQLINVAYGILLAGLLLTTGAFAFGL